MLKGAIFDVDGTLLNSMKIWDNAGEIYLTGLGKTPEPGLGRTLYAMTLEESAAYVRENYSLSQTVPEIIQGVNQVIEHFYLEEAAPKDGVKSFLQELKQRHVRMTVATTGTRYLVEAAFRRLGIDDYFDAVCTCSEIGHGKSEPDIYFRAAELMGTVPQETMVFEDAPHALMTAARAGFCTTRILDPRSPGDAPADITLPDFSDFGAFWKSADKL